MYLKYIYFMLSMLQINVYIYLLSKMTCSCTFSTLGLSGFVYFSQLVDKKKNVDFILLAPTNRQNTGSGAFHGGESIKNIIRLFSKAAWYIKPI